MSLLRPMGERSGHPFGLSDCLARKFVLCFLHISSEWHCSRRPLLQSVQLQQWVPYSNTFQLIGNVYQAVNEYIL